MKKNTKKKMGRQNDLALMLIHSMKHQWGNTCKGNHKNRGTWRIGANFLHANMPFDHKY